MKYKAWYFFCPIWFDPETNDVSNRTVLALVLWPLAVAYHHCTGWIMWLLGHDVGSVFPIKIKDERWKE